MAEYYREGRRDLRLYDDMNSVRAHDVVTAAYAQISAVQHLTKAEQVLGCVLLLREIVAHKGLDVSELFDKALRIADHDDTYFQRELAALRDYIKEELK